jgi:hypothetical protein
VDKIERLLWQTVLWVDYRRHRSIEEQLEDQACHPLVFDGPEDEEIFSLPVMFDERRLEEMVEEIDRRTEELWRRLDEED